MKESAKFAALTHEINDDSPVALAPGRTAKEGHAVGGVVDPRRKVYSSRHDGEVAGVDVGVAMEVK